MHLLMLRWKAYLHELADTEDELVSPRKAILDDSSIRTAQLLY